MAERKVAGTVGRREHERWAIRVAGSYRSPSGADVFVSVRDVSAWGCCIANPSRNLFVGDLVTVYIDGLDPVDAEVRWQNRGLVAGLAFDQPVDPEQLRLLVAHCGPRASIVAGPWADSARQAG